GITFPGTPLRRSEVVGMPLRREIVELDRVRRRAEAADFFGLDPEKKTLLAFGGSLGARRINEALAGSWRDILDAGWQLLHATGERSDLEDPGVDGYAMVRYLDRMDLAFALADLIVSRAGSSTVSEVAALGIPAVYVPYAVGNGEQRLNASSSVSAGAALLIDDAAFTPDRVRSEIVPLLRDDQRLGRMAAAAETAGTRHGTANVIAQLDRALGRVL
ncbi:glycosyltransferase, partial [Microbacterium sp.]|uniref:UDP-N-acetylglucosamine--N-acetylmuramyl- (pentapeptide) pyrophosphoryl-undecaprenol N-acetylglucosamine transferase n=1 Tax=Microbacterium sp. TaxID=51671 RepID=UPI002812579C